VVVSLPIFMEAPARVAQQTFHQPINQPTAHYDSVIRAAFLIQCEALSLSVTRPVSPGRDDAPHFVTLTAKLEIKNDPLIPVTEPIPVNLNMP
jgi:hypothetical protein